MKMLTGAVGKETVPFTKTKKIEHYNINECLELLRSLQTKDSSYLSTQENQSIIRKLENRLKELVLSK